jgi:hypothetical protein
MAQEGAQEHQEQQEHLYLRRREEGCCVCIRAPCDCACDPSPPKKPAPSSTSSWPVVLTSSPDVFSSGNLGGFSSPSETSTASFPFEIGFPASDVAGPRPSVFSALDLFGPSLGAFGAFNENDKGAPEQPFGSSTLVPLFIGLGTIPSGPTVDGSIQRSTPRLGDSGPNLVPGPTVTVNPECNPGTGGGCLIGDNGGGVNCQQGEDRIFCSSVGRPFIDATGMTITSDASTCEVSAWAAATAVSASSSSFLLQQYSHQSRNQELGSEWTRRAIGEHASIASFAVFTINLMSNQAPPDLIRDSLNAAMDELNHATTAFDMASLLTGQQIEPGALPPSKLTFDKNLTTLALATAREGCIAETLSALELAVEVDRGAADADADADDVSTMLMRKTKIIALEEGRHSVLAWRTIHWVCSADSAACDRVKREVLETTKLAGATKAYSDDIAKAWSRLYESLVPFVTMTETLPTWTSVLDCTTTTTTVIEDTDESDVTGVLVRNILKGVYCAVQSSGSLAAEM